MKTLLHKEEVKKKLAERKKEAQNKLKEKRARLVVKNLSFKVTPEKLQTYFEQFGIVKSVELLKYNDGKLKGCGFVQFELVQKAAKARHHTNGKEFLGRVLSVDFAKSKKKYEQQIKIEVKEEENNVKVEENEKQQDTIVIEENSDDECPKSESEIEDENDKIETDDEEKIEESFEDTDQVKKSPFISNDVTEGKTIFVKNVPFDATNEELKQCMLQFGRVYYAIICIDKLTEHSKGTGFVKFVNKEDAEKALNAGTELKLLGNILDCQPALDKNTVNNKINHIKEDKKQPKDSRNLYLVKEGVILAGSPAAHGVSASDMAKRLQIEQYKTQMLRNLNMFVSKDRLVVHNLPPSWDDEKLKTLFKKYAGPDAVIKEARVMRHMQNVDGNGIGQSKEYGFVSFTQNKNALTALRNLNNNPKIFSPQKRPIITFSIENKKIIKARQKRLDKSKQYNPLSKDYSHEDKGQYKRNGKITRKDFKQKKNFDRKQNEELPNYSGVTTKPGTVEKMRSRYKLVAQAKLHHENLKNEKRKVKKAAERKQEIIKQPKQKIRNRVNKKDNFSHLVSDFKKKLVNIPSGKKSKWYE